LAKNRNQQQQAREPEKPVTVLHNSFLLGSLALAWRDGLEKHGYRPGHSGQNTLEGYRLSIDVSSVLVPYDTAEPVGRVSLQYDQFNPIRPIRGALALVNTEPRTISEVLASLRPRNVLDVACGCGRFTRSLEPFCSYIVAIDSEPFMSRWRERPRDSFIQFCRMEAEALALSDGSFHLVLERFSLHHVLDWRLVLDEMFRVSKEYVLVEEPVDDLRSAAKRNSAAARSLFLELQHAVGYRHNPHLRVEELVYEMSRKGSLLIKHIEKRDGPIAFKDYFSDFDSYARESGQVDYWYKRLEAFKRRVGEGRLADDDTVLILARK
jgi:ubiquinone/menaquinone biosynthesis C-methylase UbiE